MPTEPSRHARRFSIGPNAFEAAPLPSGLYLVATPIGNLADMTVRGLETLAAADLILCEDTRTSSKLLQRYGISNRLQAYHEHNASKVRPPVLRRLAEEGAAIALISDAGMPLVSDPGFRLAREASARGISVTCCPGPSAVLTALALSGLATDRFAFLGFLPAKSGDRTRLYVEVSSLRASLIFFESPNRVIASLGEIATHLPGRTVALARELTKIHEEILRGTPHEVAELLAGRPAVKGEITLCLSPPEEKPVALESPLIENALAEALDRLPAGKAASEIARRFGVDRKEVYRRILARSGGSR